MHEDRGSKAPSVRLRPLRIMTFTPEKNTKKSNHKVNDKNNNINKYNPLQDSHEVEK